MPVPAQSKLWRIGRTGFALFGFCVLAVGAGLWVYGQIPFDYEATPEESVASEFVRAVPDDVREMLGEQWPTRAQAFALATGCFEDTPARSELERGIERACEQSRNDAGEYYSDLATLSALCADSPYEPCGPETDPHVVSLPIDDAEEAVVASQNSVECESIIDIVDTLPEDYVELAGAAAVPLPILGMQVGRSEGDLRFSKFGMAIRAGVSATVSVEAAEGDAYLDYGSFDRATTSVRSQPLTFAPCPTQAGGWVIYAGGIWTTHDGCIDVTVSSAQATEQTRLGIRVPC